MKYFDHDVESYKDDKIMLLRHAHGSEAVDAYWAIVEQIYRDEEAFSDSQPIASESLAFVIGITTERLAECISGMLEYGLLVRDEDGDLMSPRAAEKIDGYQERCAANAANAKKPRGKRKSAGGKHEEPLAKPSDSLANASESLTNHSEAQAKPSETPIEEEGEEDIGEKEKSTKKEKPDGKARAAFVSACLKVFNEETKSQIAYVDPETQMRLGRIQDTGRTIDDVRCVVRYLNGEWGPDPKMSKWIRPKTFFGDQFESYLATARRKQAERSEREGRYAKYA